MTETRGGQASASFVRQVRKALYHLYDPLELQKSPLITLLGIKRENDPLALHRVLMDAIEALKPATGTPVQTKAWRMYRALYHRYVEQFPQSEVATALALGIRHTRRQEDRGLRALANHLWTRYDVGSRRDVQADAPSYADKAASEQRPMPDREQELEWLERTFQSKPTDLGALIRAVLRTIHPLLSTLAVRVETALPEDLPRVAVQPESMRQALLHTLTASVRSIAGGAVRITATTGPRKVYVRVDPLPGPGSPVPEGGDQRENLEMARQLLALSGGELEMERGAYGVQGFSARLILPTAEQVAVLVIDDNVDTLQLFQRYLAGSRYPFIGARDPEQALALAEQLTPQIIVLDVMLPGIDGWELLGRLREHPKMGGVPIIVCTILPEKRLALALGAAAFLRKPVTREAFLAALDRQAVARSRAGE